MAYCTPKDVWDWLNGSTRVYQELVNSSGDGTTQNYNLTNSAVLSGSVIIRYADHTTSAGYLTASTLTSSEFTVDYDRGILQLTTAGATTVSGSAVFADYDYAPINNTIVTDLISGSDREIDRMTGRDWNSSSDVTEYISVEPEQTVFFTAQYPHLTVSAVAENLSAASDTPNWVTRSSGFGNDYLNSDEDKLYGRIRFVDNDPDSGTDKLKVIYQYGYTSVPQEIKRLAIMKSVKTMLQNPAFANKIIGGRDTFMPMDLGVIETEIQQIIKELRKFKYDRI